MLGRVARDFDRNDYLSVAAALAFFFLLALFPLLIFLSGVLSFVWNGALFEELIRVISGVVPQDAMGLVVSVLDDILQTNAGLLSIGMAGALFAASGGFSAMIGALNVAYDVPEGRPYWKKRVVALGLTILVGVLSLAALLALVLGPRFGAWLTETIGTSPWLRSVWPYLRWSVAVGFAILSVELLYFLAPNVKQRFRAQVPGAILAIAAWVGSSFALSWYLRYFSSVNKIYGTLGAVIALMLWLYVSALAVLVGAEVNSELARERGTELPEKERSRRRYTREEEDSATKEECS